MQGGIQMKNNQINEQNLNKDDRETNTKKLELNVLPTRKIHLKKLEDQVIVITGASSGIGLVTARMAASKGAKVVLAARNEDALKELVKELEEKGYPATFVKADVGREEDVKKI